MLVPADTPMAVQSYTWKAGLHRHHRASMAGRTIYQVPAVEKRIIRLCLDPADGRTGKDTGSFL
jgi:hypothetical protein